MDVNTMRGGGVVPEACLDAFDIDAAEAASLREAVDYLSPSPLIFDARRVFDYGRQHEIPQRALDLFRATRKLKLSAWEQESIRSSLNSRNGALRRLLEMKADRSGVKDSKSTYIRVDCFGKRIQSPCLLEIWPGGHHSPIHEHANSIGLMKGVFGRVDIMLYESLAAAPKKLALLSMTADRCSWMSPEHYQAHKVYCPMDQNDFAATFHIYTETKSNVFKYREEQAPHRINEFVTESDISWGEFYKALTDAVPYYGD
ncbi:MAG TPA: hypothetical protein VK148_14945 [Xanthobacteraceae bacterium]|nr:hypothetical protein [Xanthobacteraceae bacterium]